jgi:hypothetical protein
MNPHVVVDSSSAPVAQQTQPGTLAYAITHNWTAAQFFDPSNRQNVPTGITQAVYNRIQNINYAGDIIENSLISGINEIRTDRDHAKTLYDVSINAYNDGVAQARRQYGTNIPTNVQAQLVNLHRQASSAWQQVTDVQRRLDYDTSYLTQVQHIVSLPEDIHHSAEWNQESATSDAINAQSNFATRMRTALQQYGQIDQFPPPVRQELNRLGGLATSTANYAESGEAGRYNFNFDTSYLDPSPNYQPTVQFSAPGSLPPGVSQPAPTGEPPDYYNLPKL